jgi:hypothetical protein
MSRKCANDGARAEVAARGPFRGLRGRPRRARLVRNVAFRQLRSVAAGPAAIATVLVALTGTFGGTPASAAALYASSKAVHVAGRARAPAQPGGQLPMGRADAAPSSMVSAIRL